MPGMMDTVLNLELDADGGGTVFGERGPSVDYHAGPMIEIPRAVLPDDHLTDGMLAGDGDAA